MTTAEKLLKTIKHAKHQNKKLTNAETLQVIKAYRAIAMQPQLIDKIINVIDRFIKQESYSKNLSNRQNEIFNLIGLEFTSREIGEILTISEATVSTHRKNIIKKLGFTGAGKLQRAAYSFIQRINENKQNSR